MSGETPRPIDPDLLRRVDLVVTLGREAVVDVPVGTPSRATGTPTSPPNAGSGELSGCGWYVTTSTPACRALLTELEERRREREADQHGDALPAPPVNTRN